MAWRIMARRAGAKDNAFQNIDVREIFPVLVPSIIHAYADLPD